MADEILCDVPAQHESDSGSGREYPMRLDGQGWGGDRLSNFAADRN